MASNFKQKTISNKEGCGYEVCISIDVESKGVVLVCVVTRRHIVGELLFCLGFIMYVLVYRSPEYICV